jgi:single-strand DNA-binding protein
VVKMLNRTLLTGRTTKNIELKYTPNGVAIGSFTLAVNRNFKNGNGETETDFIQCLAWRKLAETMGNHVTKGSLIGVEGRLQTRSFEDQTGKRIFVTELVVDNFTFLESKNAKQEQPPEQMNRYGA